MHAALSMEAVAAVMLLTIERLYLCRSSAEIWAVLVSTGTILKSFFSSSVRCLAVSCPSFVSESL